MKINEKKKGSEYRKKIHSKSIVRTGVAYKSQERREQKKRKNRKKKQKVSMTRTET